MHSQGSAESVPGSTSTLGQGMALLEKIANDGVVKQEPPDDEAEILKQIQVGQLLNVEPRISREPC